MGGFRSGPVEDDIEGAGPALVGVLWGLEIDDQGGVGGVAGAAAGVVGGEVGVAGEVELGGEGAEAGASDGEVDVGGSHGGAEGVVAGVDGLEAVASLVVGEELAAEAVVLVGAVVVAFGVGVPDVEEGAGDGGLAVGAVDGALDQEGFAGFVGAGELGSLGGAVDVEGAADVGAGELAGCARLWRARVGVRCEGGAAAQISQQEGAGGGAEEA